MKQEQTTSPLKRFAHSELCRVGFGVKWHLRNGLYTYCGIGPIEDIGPGIIAVREDYERICKQCLKQYRKYREQIQIEVKL